MCLVASTAGARPPHHVDGGFRNLADVERAGPSVTVPFFARRVWATLTGRDGAALGRAERRRVPARQRAPQRTDRDVDRPRHGPRADGRRHVPHRSDLVGAGEPVRFRGSEAIPAARHRVRALPPIDFVVVSHSHYDHADLPTLARLAATGARIFVPLELGRVLRERRHPRRRGARLVGAPPGRPRARASACPPQHWSARSLFDKDETLWSGWAVVGPTRRFYFAGDTGYFPGFAEIGDRAGPLRPGRPPDRRLRARPDDAALPHEPRRSRPRRPRRPTADAARRPLRHLRPDGRTARRAPARFHKAAEAAHIASDRVWTPPIGETKEW